MIYMGTLMHADVFFFVTTIALVVIALFCVVALIVMLVILWRAKKIVDEVHGIAQEVRAEVQLVREDIKDARAKLTTGMKIKSVFDLVMGIIKRHKSKGESKRQKAK